LSEWKQSLAESRDAGDDLVGGLGPHERLGSLVRRVDVRSDRLLQLLRRPMVAAPERVFRLIESRARQGFGGPRPPGTDQAILEQAQRLRARLGLT
jgi:hypothetical protein